MSPVMDDRGRLFGRVNILDLLVLLLIVALAIFALTRVHDTTSTTFKLRTTLKADKLRYAPVDKIKVGQTVRDDSGNVLGKVESVYNPFSTEEVPTAAGGLNTPISTMYHDLTVVVVGEAQGSVSSPRIGNTRIQSNALFQVSGPDWTVKMQIVGFEQVKP
jgi:Domain of unknown function (DUF4330)